MRIRLFPIIFGTIMRLLFIIISILIWLNFAWLRNVYPLSLRISVLTSRKSEKEKFANLKFLYILKYLLPGFFSEYFPIG